MGIKIELAICELFSYNIMCFAGIARTVSPDLTDSVIQVLPPITQLLPIFTSPPRIVAPEYITTLFPMSG